MRRAVALASVLLVVLVPRAAWCGPEGDTPRVYGLDHAAFAETQIAALRARGLEVSEERVRAAARQITVLLVLRPDAAFDLDWKQLIQGHPCFMRISGSWAEENGHLLLDVRKRDWNVSIPGWLEDGKHTCPIRDGRLELPSQDPDTEGRMPLRPLPEADATLVAANPSERAALLRSRLAPPSHDTAVDFACEAFAVGGAAARIGTPRFAAMPATYEGQPAWRVTESLFGSDTTTAWLAPDLTVLRMTIGRSESPESVPEEARTPAETQEYTRTATGYRVVETRGEAERLDYDLETVERPYATMTALFLLLRAAPDLALEYEIPWLQPGADAALPRDAVTIHGASRLELREMGLSRASWEVAARGIRIHLTREDRSPMFLGAGGMGRALLIAAPGLLDVYAVMQLSVPPRSAKDAASVFLYAAVTGDRKTLERVLDFGALYAGARRAGYDGAQADFREELLAKLERRRGDLLPNEASHLLSMVGRVREVTTEGDTIRVTLHPPCEDYQVLVRETSDGFRVAGLRPCIDAETRCCGHEWTDPDTPEPAVGGCRLWLYRRNLRHPFHEQSTEAARALGSLGEVVVPMLFDDLGQANDAEADRSYVSAIGQALAASGVPVLARLLEARTRADAASRWIFDTVAHNLTRGRSPFGSRDGARESLPALLGALDADWPAVVEYVLVELSSMGPSAADAIPRLEALLRAAEPRSAYPIRSALKRLRQVELRILLDAGEAPDEENGSMIRVEVYRPGEYKGRGASLDVESRGPVLSAVGDVEPGTYVVVIRREPFPLVVVPDVVIGRGVTRLEPVRILPGCSVRVRLRAPEDSSQLIRRAVATFLDGPSYRRSARAAGDRREVVIDGLGKGRFRLVVSTFGGRKALADREIEADGVTDLEIDIDAE